MVWLFLRVVVRYKLAQWRTRGLPDEFADAFWEICHRRTAEELYHTTLIVGGMYTKLGQAVSGRADILPPPFVRQLRKLQDQLKADDEAHVRETLRSELKIESIKSVFASFDFKAVASASIAQVHRATLPDGSRVAVKLQHQGVEELMRADAAMVTRLFWATGVLFPARKSMFSALSEFVRKMEPELDFSQEMTTMRSCREALKRAPASLVDKRRVAIPRAFPRLSTRRVLVMEYMEGERLPDEGDDTKVRFIIFEFIFSVLNSDPLRATGVRE